MPKIKRSQQRVCRALKAPPIGPGQSPGGDEEAKHWEVFRISYFSLRSVIFCESLHNLQIT